MVDAVQRAFLGVHGSIYTRTDGRVGHGLIGVPCLILRTTGARSGLTRTSVLVYADDGDDLVVVTSNGGQDHPPGWLHNVRAHPDVEVQIRRRRFAARARELTPDDAGYARLWRAANDVNHDRYEAYQRRTARPIALVVLTPGAG
jgi:deazaflavin-dependent oxidoreductase (nitroreductase family)